MEGCTAAGVIAEAGVLGRALVVGVLLLGCALWPSTAGAAQVATQPAQVAGAPAPVASFDCSKAVSPMEKAICSDKDLSAADVKMAAAYRQAIDLMPAEAVANFRADQRTWLVALERGCQIAEVEEASKGGKPQDVADNSAEGKQNLARMAGCMKGAWDNRTDVLKHGYAQVDGVSFVTRSVLLLSPDSSPDRTVADGMEEFPGFGSLAVSWPEAQSTDPRWTAWNAAVVRKLQTGLVEQGKSFKPGWRDSMAADTDSTLVAGTPSMRQNRVSVGITMNNMGHGAAHPNEAYLSFTWLLDKQRALTPQDVFKAGSAWKQALAAYAWNDLSHGDKSEGLYDTKDGAHTKALLDDLSDTDNWTLTARGLSLGWPEYTLAPRLYQLDDTVVPWATLRPLLVPGFVP